MLGNSEPRASRTEARTPPLRHTQVFAASLSCSSGYFQSFTVIHTISKLFLVSQKPSTAWKRTCGESFPPRGLTQKPPHAPVDWNTPLLHWQYRWAKASIIRSIFWASPGSRKLHRNCLRVETGALLWPALLLVVALISEGKGRWGGFRPLLQKLNRSKFSHCPSPWL